MRSNKKYPVPANAFSVFVNLIDVKIKGYIKMISSAHERPLKIQPNFINKKADLEALTSAVELCMDLAMEPALKNIIKQLVAPAARTNRQEIQAFIKDACSTYFHPVRTFATGNGKEAVVNN